jgi:hypothetical protein
MTRHDAHTETETETETETMTGQREDENILHYDTWYPDRNRDRDRT